MSTITPIGGPSSAPGAMTMNEASIAAQSTRHLLRRAAQAGFLFFLAKGCAWLLAIALLGDLL